VRYRGGGGGAVIVSIRLRGLIALLVVVPLGCSFSYSSESSAKSLASPFTSSSSSSGGTTTQAYRDDVRDYTYAYVSSRGDIDAFERGLDDIARKHGVTNWEEDNATYLGIGAGLAKARVSAVAFETFKQNLGHGDPSKMHAIQKGYDSYGE
jgi:hypothetical protein